MRPSDAWVSPEELEDLNRLSREQVGAARAGDLKVLRGLLESKQRLLDGLRGRAIRPEHVTQLSARDAETRLLVEAQIGQVEAALIRLREGGQVLSRYAMRIEGLPGFIDQLR
jgi:hypothetical protein